MGDKFEPVVLVDPNDQEYTANNAVELNDLTWGRGYRIKDVSKNKAKPPSSTPREG